jgi:hypothetical protein
MAYLNFATAGGKYMYHLLQQEKALQSALTADN